MFMRQFSILILMAALFWPTGWTGNAYGQGRPEFTVSVLTVAPGPRAHELFGHIVLRIRGQGLDISYEWGIFDDTQPNFLWNFANGYLIYAMYGRPTWESVAMAREDGRAVEEQVLNLTESQAQQLVRNLLANDTDANRNYRYDPLLDNCSTRLRDALDAPGVLDGLLERTADGQLAETWRFDVRRMSSDNLPVDLGLQVAQGAPVDRPMTRYQSTFLPEALSHLIDDARLSDGSPLVGGTFKPVDLPSLPLRDRPADSRMFMLLISAVWGFGLVAVKRKSIPFAILAALWHLLAGVLGCVLLLLLTTDHWYSHWNANLFLFNPLSLLLVPMIPLSFVRENVLLQRSTRLLAVVTLLLAGAGVLINLLPIFSQVNGAMVLLALPPHLAVALSLEWRHRRDRRQWTSPPAETTMAAATT